MGEKVEISHNEQADVGKDASEFKYSASEAKEAADLEKNMPVWTAIKVYRKAVMWSILISMCIIQEGYDIVLINGLIAMPSFQKRYGNFYPGIGYEISAKWQLAIGNGTTVGTIIGAFANGILIEKFGYRKVLICCLFSVNALIFMTFFAPSIQVLFVGELLCGLPW